ncbi:MAG: hypothetical protein EG825_05365 [Rhodocyclaceae bacterium]|nr:hypothetical protein [Rhodocyclaceae bacterium]
MTERNFENGPPSQSSSPADMISIIRRAWSLSADQLARVFGVEKTTCYAWSVLKEREHVRPDKLDRMERLTQIAQRWAMRGHLPGGALTWALPDRPTLLDLLSSPDLDETAILDCFDRLAAVEGDILKERGKQTRELAAVIGAAAAASGRRPPG